MDIKPRIFAAHSLVTVLSVLLLRLIEVCAAYATHAFKRRECVEETVENGDGYIPCTYSKPIFKMLFKEPVSKNILEGKCFSEGSFIANKL